MALTSKYLFFAERHGKSKCDSEIGEAKRLLKQNLPADGVGNIKDLQKILQENSMKSKNHKEFIIHQDDVTFQPKSIQLANIKQYLYFSRKSKDSKVLAFHTFESTENIEVNMKEKDLEKKERKHSIEKEKVPQTSTPPRVQSIIGSRMDKEQVQESEEEEKEEEGIDDEPKQILQNKRNNKKNQKPFQMNKRKRRRIDFEEDDEDIDISLDESEQLRDEFSSNEDDLMEEAIEKTNKRQGKRTIIKKKQYKEQLIR
ncbi:MAG: hypothetical protein EZS28_004598 [Streblomastix strix]|uniref:Uncharacterized protein n=1 Tax=Streblomastix strix TaxID=222440 RepID=A0A5J4WYH1_9EUKA|nr:MAG: hypothetical protein EZS28_004598 [Streblomastix strix]